MARVSAGVAPGRSAVYGPGPLRGDARAQAGMESPLTEQSSADDDFAARAPNSHADDMPDDGLRERAGDQTNRQDDSGVVEWTRRTPWSKSSPWMRIPAYLTAIPALLDRDSGLLGPGTSVCESTGVVHCGRCQGPAVAPRRQPTGRGNTDSLQVHVSGAPRCCAVPRCESIRYEATALDRASIPVMHAQGAVGARYAPRGSRDRARPSSAGSGAAVPQA